MIPLTFCTNWEEGIQALHSYKAGCVRPDGIPPLAAGPVPPMSIVPMWGRTSHVGCPLRFAGVNLQVSLLQRVGWRRSWRGKMNGSPRGHKQHLLAQAFVFVFTEKSGFRFFTS